MTSTGGGDTNGSNNSTLPELGRQGQQIKNGQGRPGDELPDIRRGTSGGKKKKEEVQGLRVGGGGGGFVGGGGVKGQMTNSKSLQVKKRAD